MYDHVKNSEDAEAAEDSYDTYICAELNSPDADGNAVYGRVNKCFWNHYGKAIIVVNWNPFFDMNKYEVEYLDGYIEEMTNNQISGNMLSHIDSQCNHFLFLKNIKYH